MFFFDGLIVRWPDGYFPNHQRSGCLPSTE